MGPPLGMQRVTRATVHPGSHLDQRHLALCCTTALVHNKHLSLVISRKVTMRGGHSGNNHGHYNTMVITMIITMIIQLLLPWYYTITITILL